MQNSVPTMKVNLNELLAAMQTKLLETSIKNEALIELMYSKNLITKEELDKLAQEKWDELLKKSQTDIVIAKPTTNLLVPK